ncbi:MAG: hypothetical protein JXQ75_22920 [Phycisphaerae bacterium]|nr:hypothetical protein [Phycisphaerae bacterium]
MPDESGYHIDVVSAVDGGEAGVTEPRQAARQRPWVGIHFECCDTYARIYRDTDAAKYEGHCPRCGRGITLRVGPDGVDSRIFRATPI